MADQFRYKLLTDLTAKDAPSDTDLFAVGNNGSSGLRKLTFASIANAIKTKLLTWTFTNLTTSKKNLPEAINELNSKLGVKYIIQPGGTLSLSGGNGTLPNAYILVTRGSMTNLLNVYIGTGYGATVARHRMSALFSQGSEISVTISDTAYGLTIANGATSVSLEVYVTNIS